MADIIDNAREKTKLLRAFLESTKKISDALQNPEDDSQIEVISAEVDKRDNYISEINLINKLIGASAVLEENQKSELDKETGLWFGILEEIQGIEQKNNGIINGLNQEYMGKVKSAKDSIKVIDAYSKLMTDGLPLSGSIDKKK